VHSLSSRALSARTSTGHGVSVHEVFQAELQDCNCRLVSMVAGPVVALVLLLLVASVAPCSVAAQEFSAESNLTVYRETGNGTAAVPVERSIADVVAVRTGSELVHHVRNGYRYLIIRSHLDLSDASGLPGMDTDAILVPPGSLALMVRFSCQFNPVEKTSRSVKTKKVSALVI
jgi:hypothetical protein